MHSQRSITEMSLSATKFRFIDLPADVRCLIYDHIVLTPYQKSPTINKRRCTKEEQHHITQRRICHETAKSLSLSCKLINIEITPTFWRNKTIKLSAPGHEIQMIHPATNFFSSFDPRKLGLIRHVEFDLQQHETLDSEHPRLGNAFMMINNYLKIVEHKLPELQTITCKLVDTMSWLNIDADKSTSPGAAILPRDSPYFGFATNLRYVGHRQPGSTSWEPRSSKFLAQLRMEDVGTKEFHGWAHGLTRIHLPDRRWASSCIIEKTAAWDDEKYVVHQVRFEKWTPALVEETIESQRLRREGMMEQDDSDPDLDLQDEDNHSAYLTTFDEDVDMNDVEISYRDVTMTEEDEEDYNDRLLDACRYAYDEDERERWRNIGRN